MKLKLEIRFDFDFNFDFEFDCYFNCDCNCNCNSNLDWSLIEGKFLLLLSSIRRDICLFCFIVFVVGIDTQQKNGLSVF